MKSHFPRVYKSLRFLGRRTIFWCILVVIASLTLAIVELAIAAFIQMFLKSLKIVTVDLGWIDRLFPENVETKAVLFFLLAIAIVRSLATFFSNQGNNVVQESLNNRLRNVAIYNLLLHPKQRPIPASEMNTLLGEVFPKAATFINYATNILGFLIQALCMSAILVRIAWRESIVALVGLFLIGAAVLIVNRRVRRIASGIPAEHNVLTQGIERIARNWMLVRILKTQKLEHARFQNSIDAYTRKSIRASSWGTVASSGAPFLGILLLMLIIYCSQNIFFTPGVMLLSFLYLFVRYVQLLASLAGSMSWISMYWPQFKHSVNYFMEFSKEQINTALQTNKTVRSSQDTNLMPCLPPPIEVNKISFTYPMMTEPVLNAFTLHIPAGTFVGIIGQSGSGKSTLLSILMGLYEPTQGKVSIADMNPKSYFDQDNSNVGYVGAESFLIAGTIEENLRYGLRVPKTEDDIWKALEQAKLSDYVRTLSHGLQYRISPTGEGLSAGQKQRLCLARAFLSQPKLLVLDEVSANLDVETESEISDSLLVLKGTCTMIIVSHREGILKHADSIITLGSQEI